MCVLESFLNVKQQTKTFEEKISKLSKKTRANINASRHSFEKFCSEYYDGRKADEVFEELHLHKGNKQNVALRDVFQNWVDWQYKNGSLTSSIQQYVSKIKRVFSHHGLIVHPEDFPEPLEFKPKIKEELHQLTVKEIQSILKHASPKKIGFYLALSCTGARPSELLQVRKKDVDTTQKRIKIRIEAENVKTRSGRSIWLTKEAGSYLMIRLKNLEDNDLVWATNENVSYAEKNESTQFGKCCDKAGFTEKYKSNNFRKITLYSFRSFFFGMSSDVHREGYAHNMIGHGGYLPQYDRMSDEKKLELFLELEPKLIIDEEVRLREENRIKDQQIKELESDKDKRISELESRMQNIQELLKRSKSV